MNRRRLVTRLGVTGAALGVAAGLVQVFLGYAIPDWTGDKLATAALGLLTVGLSAIAGMAALRQRSDGLSVLSRAACSFGMVGPGLLCLTTVGRLWFLPGALLTVAGVLTIERWRATASALARDGNRVLLSALGLCELLMVAAGPASLMVVGGAGAAALLVAAWWRSASRRAVAGLVALGTIPFAALGWTVAAPVLLAVVAWLVALPLLQTHRPRRVLAVTNPSTEE